MGERPSSDRSSQVWERELHMYRMELSLITRQLAIMLAAGVDLRRALSVLSGGASSEESATVLGRLQIRIEQGWRLSSAMREFPRVFDPVYLAMVEVGEETGQIVKTLHSLSDWLSQEHQLKRQVRAALTYPAIVLFVAGLLTVAFFTIIFPGFEQTLSSLPELPWLTRLLVAISQGFRSPLAWLIALLWLVACLALARKFLSQPGARARSWRLLSQVPFVGVILRDFSASRFAAVMAIMLDTGVDILRSFQLACLASGSPLVVEKMKEGTSTLSLGGDLTDFLKDNPLSFPPVMTGLVQVGQESADLVFTFDCLRRYLAEDAEHRVRSFIAVLEPLLMAWVSVLVGLLVIGVALPMYGMVGQSL